MVHHRMAGRTAVSIAVGAVLLTAAGCASSAGSSTASPGSSATSSASTGPSATGSGSPSVSASSSSAPVDQSSPQVLAAIATYRSMWADVVKVQETMNDQDPTLANHLTGGALSYFDKAIHVNKLNGYVSKGQPKLLHPAGKEVVGSGDSAKVLVEDCVDDSGYNLYTTDGTYVNNGHPGGRRLTQALVEQFSGVLKVSAFAYSAPGTC